MLNPKWSLTLSMALLVGCANSPPKPLQYSPGFTPVVPVTRTTPDLSTGAIYNGRQSDNWFGGLRSYQVGDKIGRAHV